MKLKISKLLFVKADWDRTFMAEIFNDKTPEGKDVVRGTVMVNGIQAWSVANTVNELGNYFDEMCVLILDHKLHEKQGKTEVVAGNTFYLN